MRVLVADDDPIVRALVRSVVSSLGLEPEWYGDGLEAWARYEAAPAPLCVLDVDMPGLDGVLLTRRIRERTTGAQPYILVFTGSESPSILAEVMEAGADDYVPKPASPQTLRARLIIAERRIAMDAERRAAIEALARSQWLAGIGETTLALEHEINNPLSALLGEAELLLMETPPDAPHHRAVSVIEEQGRRIANVVKRLTALKQDQAHAASVGYVGDARMLDLRDAARGDDPAS